ncbi:MAG: hypothetical protein GY756_15735 [bacterium]|nr:hypothetical protein [bacterium]
MLSIIVSIGLGGFIGLLLYDQQIVQSANWCLTIGILILIISQVLLGLFVRKIVKKRTNDIQNIITSGQEKLNRKVQFFQQKPQGGMKTMQKILEKDQHVFIREALDSTKRMEKLYPWNLLLKKQVSTMRMQFYYQLKDFKKCDELLPKAMYVDPMSVAMKMARQYKNEDVAGYNKTFKKKSKKFKKDNSSIVFATYSWILVKTGRIDEAIKVLQKGKEKTENEVLIRNWECVINDKLKRFSNAGFGDQWYSLYLEEPKNTKPKQKVMRKQQYR